MRAQARRFLFTATIFAGSFLLFLIQPMIARMALPRLGGAPAVWNSAMLVYQALLLAGYAYAHALARLPARRQALIHLAAFLLAAVFLPIGLASGTPPPGSNSFLWVPWLLASSIGPLFLLISANALLLQRWFAASGGGDPYPLYAASNLGSFAGLLTYPLLLEPLMPLTGQRLLWSGGYGLVLALLLACALTVRKIEAPAAPRVTPASSLGPSAVARWLWLAFLPSGLMLSTTLFITTDINPMPMLWVLPLGLYLLSFTIAFSARGLAARLFAVAAPYLLVPASIALFIGHRLPLPVTAGILLAALFAISVACHLKLYQGRPEPGRLTSFYLALAAGGALGGVFCGLVAPLIFNWTYEFPLLLLGAAITLLPGYVPLVPQRWFERPSIRAAAIVLSGLVLVAAATAVSIWPRNDDLVRYGAFAVLVLGSLAVGSRALLVATMVAAMILSGGWDKARLSLTSGGMFRTYFGVYSIVEHSASRHLLHGTTLHGVQLLTPGWESWQTTYYARDSGAGQALQLVPRMFGAGARISVVGLGTGTLACYRQAGQRWTFFELDPAVADLATNSGKFTFLRRCAPDARTVLGDARIELARQPAAAADVLVVDAFSSDAVPVHLLTKEAFAVYARHLRPDGLLLLHISNRHLDLEPVAFGADGWHARIGSFSPAWDYRQLTASDWVALSRSPATMANLIRGSEKGFWTESDERPLRWTDDHVSLLSVIK